MAIAASRPPAVSVLAVPVAFVVANAASYALLVIAAHLLPGADYGRLSSLLGLLLISTIPMLALQTVTARRVATDGSPAGIVRGTAAIGIAATLVLVALSPALAAFLHLPGVVGVLLVAATIPATAVLGTAMGVAQGRRRFRRLAGLILAGTGGRSVGALVGLVLGRTPEATLVGLLVGTASAALLVTAAGSSLATRRASLRDRTRTGLLLETAHAAHAHGTFLLLTSLDVLLARHVLDPAAAGLFSVGSIATRAALWVPQAAVVLMFASLAEAEHHVRTARRASAVVIGLGIALVLGASVLGGVAVTVIGGSRYRLLDGYVWLFVLLGSLLALVQLAVLAGLAQRRTRRALLLWAMIAADLGLVLTTSHGMTPERLVVTLVAVAAVAGLVALAVTVRPTRAGPAPSRSAGRALHR